MTNTLTYQFSNVALISSLALGGVSFEQLANNQLQLIQVKQAEILVQEFFDLIIASKASISSLQGSVKSLTYNQEFSENLIKIAGKQAYGQMLATSKKAVTRDIEEVKQAQQQLKEFIQENQEFMMSLEPEVRQQVLPILTINIPSQMKVWQAEQHQLNEMWKCSAVKTAPVCY